MADLSVSKRHDLDEAQLLQRQTRFLQHESVSIVISTGYVDAIAVWHQAPDSSSITESCG